MRKTGVTCGEKSRDAANLTAKFQAGEEAKMQSQNDDVQAQVLNALHWDLGVPRDRLSVEVEDGWVTVSGIVDRPYQKTRAEFDARSVPGVIGVISLIRLARLKAPSLKQTRSRKAVIESADSAEAGRSRSQTAFSMPPSTKYVEPTE